MLHHLPKSSRQKLISVLTKIRSYKMTLSSWSKKIIFSFVTVEIFVPFHVLIDNFLLPKTNLLEIPKFDFNLSERMLSLWRKHCYSTINNVLKDILLLTQKCASNIQILQNTYWGKIPNFLRIAQYLIWYNSDFVVS